MNIEKGIESYLCQPLLQHSAIGMYCIDLSGKFIYVNPKMADLSGYRTDEMIGQSFAMLFGPKMFPLVNDAFNRVAEHGQTIEGRGIEIVTKSGSIVGITINWNLLQVTSKTTIIAGTADINRGTQQDPEIIRLANFFKDSPNPVLQIREDGAVAYANTPSQFLLKAWGCLDSQRLPESLRETMVEVLFSGEIRHEDVVLGDKAFTLTLSPSVEVKAINIYGTDITDRKQAEEELRLAYEGLEAKVAERTTDLKNSNEKLKNEINERKRIEAEIREINQKLNEAQSQLMQSEKMASIGQLAAGVAHEINNPVGYVNSNIGSLKKYVEDLFRVIATYEACEIELPSDDERLVKIKKIKDEVDLQFLKEDIPELLNESLEGVRRVKQIVQDLKDYSHVDEAEWQLADLHKGIDSTLNIVRNEIKYKADVVKEYATLPDVECIPSQINQVITNLLVNSSHAIEERGAITIRTGVQGEEVWLEFKDTGKGIAKENLSRIFEPFFTTKPVGKGTGLGLSLSYGIITKHHGRIEVESEVGKGSVFRIYLPVSQAAYRAKTGDEHDRPVLDTVHE